MSISRLEPPELTEKIDVAESYYSQNELPVLFELILATAKTGMFSSRTGPSKNFV
jgi:hypothetical protein